MFKKYSIFEKINKYLLKRGYQLVFSLFLSEYNNSNIYIRFDYLPKLDIYKVVWFDLDYLDIKNIKYQINEQIVDSNISSKIINDLENIAEPDGKLIIPDILDDKVEMLGYLENGPREYVFNRFLPLEWDFFLEIIVMLFAYLPRGFDSILNELLAKYDGKEEYYNSLRPIKYDIYNEKLDKKFFRKNIMERGLKYYNDERVTFLEKMDKHYLAIVEGAVPYLVNIVKKDDSYVSMFCNCKCNFFCKHIYATILAIRNKKYNSFYKVSYIGHEQSYLDHIAYNNFFLCFGVDNDSLLLVTREGIIYKAPIIQNGKCVFEVIEDDDDCNLSKVISEYQKK